MGEIVVAEDKRSTSVKRLSLSLSSSESENNQESASLGRLVYDSVSSEKVSFSAQKVIREVTSVKRRI